MRKSSYILVFKIIIVCISVWVIYRQVIVKDSFKETMTEYRMLLEERHTWMVIVVLTVMMFFNWMLEAVKWQILMKKIQKVKLVLSIRAIFSGITASFFTPNRIGEFAGRIMHIDNEVRIKAAIATIIGSMNQLLVTVIAGVIALLVNLKDSFAEMHFAYSVICVLSIIALAAIVVLYFNVAHFYDFFHRFKMFRNIDEYVRVFTFYHASELRKITLLSMARYFIFTSQFVLLLNLLKVDIEMMTAYRLIFLIFLVMAVVPTFALAELSVRGSIALYFIQPFSSNSTGIVAATFSLWFINLVIPSVIGAFTLFYVRLKKPKG